MSEEKLYMVKNDEGKYWDFNDLDGFWELIRVSCPITVSKENAKNEAKEHGGHIVALIEEPEKVKLPKKVAEWIDRVKDGGYDITYIFTEYAMPNEVSDWLEDSDDDAEHREERGLMLINAYLYGYTVAKEKRYVLPMPGTDYHNNLMHGNVQYYAVKGTGNWRTDRIALDTDDAVKSGYTVTQSDIDVAPAWVKAITPVEVTDDEQ